MEWRYVRKCCLPMGAIMDRGKILPIHAALTITLRWSLRVAAVMGILIVVGFNSSQAKAVESVKVCSLYGAGFYYIPATETCIKIGGELAIQVGSGTVCSSGKGRYFVDRNNCGRSVNEEEKPVSYVETCRRYGVGFFIYRVPILA